MHSPPIRLHRSQTATVCLLQLIRIWSQMRFQSGTDGGHKSLVAFEEEKKVPMSRACKLGPRVIREDRSRAWQSGLFACVTRVKMCRDSQWSSLCIVWLDYEHTRCILQFSFSHEKIFWLTAQLAWSYSSTFWPCPFPSNPWPVKLFEKRREKEKRVLRDDFNDLKCGINLLPPDLVNFAVTPTEAGIGHRGISYNISRTSSTPLT